MTDATSANPAPGSQAWLDQVTEPIIDPQRAIVDPHHHLWQRGEGNDYVLEHLWADTETGHHITKTVFVECGAGYRDSGPQHLRCIGETEFVAGIAADSVFNQDSKAVISAIVSRADLTRPDLLNEVLDAHELAGQGLFRGIRHAGAREEQSEALTIPGRAPAGLYENPGFRAGVQRLGELSLTYDTWHYHHQNRDFAELARAVPGTTMILDHFGTPLGVGPYTGKREEIFEQWREDIGEIARCENVVAKLGGLAMPDNGFGWDKQEQPPTSDEFVAAQKRYYLHTIECFGVERCMFESNFPVDRRSLSYAVLFNGLKKIAAEFTDAEQDMLFSGTASKIYRL